ncbi:Helicase c-terminal domain containing protein, partial [Daphnia magna]
SDLKNYDKPEVAREEDIGVEEAFKRFPERMLADIEAELERQVDKILDSLRKQIHQVASNQVSNLDKINSEIFTTFCSLLNRS